MIYGIKKNKDLYIINAVLVDFTHATAILFFGNRIGAVKHI